MSEDQIEITSLLNCLSDELDIPESHYTKATERYDSIGQFMHRRDSGVLNSKPAFYPQGSFSLGTVTKSPKGQKASYDLDSVLELTKLTKEGISQYEVKAMVGAEVKLYAKQNGINKPVDEGNRCWTLEYSDNDVEFHIDILPAIPDDLATKRALVLDGVDQQYAARAVAITDKQSPYYKQLTNQWPRGNPRGYGSWFRDVMRLAGKQLLAARRITASIDDVPTYMWKTPLQRIVQILKRHRDVFFSRNPEQKPASIIVTTLAAQSYCNELNIDEAIRNIVAKMPGLIERRGDEFWIPNPVNRMENFADRWNADPTKALLFFNWISKFQSSVQELFGVTGLNKAGELIKSSFGEDVAHGSLIRMGESIREARRGSNLFISSSGILGSRGKPVKKHEFYGEACD